MARGKAINVKIATVKIVKALEASLAKLEKDYSAQETNEAKYKKAYKAWQKEIGKWAIDNFSKGGEVNVNYRSWNKTLNVDFDITCEESSFPAQPEKDYEFIHASTYRESKKELENAIRILKMTDEETVNTSTYNAVAEYL
jgi:hypothetical protein